VILLYTKFGKEKGTQKMRALLDRPGCGKESHGVAVP
jgi:hypothetical protein